MAYKIIYNIKECIGAGECETLSKQLWKMENNGKATLKGATLNNDTKMYEYEIPDSEVELQKKIAKSCPGNCIKVVNT